MVKWRAEERREGVREEIGRIIEGEEAWRDGG